MSRRRLVLALAFVFVWAPNLVLAETVGPPGLEKARALDQQLGEIYERLLLNREAIDKLHDFLKLQDWEGKEIFPWQVIVASVRGAVTGTLLFIDYSIAREDIDDLEKNLVIATQLATGLVPLLESLHELCVVVAGLTSKGVHVEKIVEPFKPRC